MEGAEAEVSYGGGGRRCVPGLRQGTARQGRARGVKRVNAPNEQVGVPAACCLLPAGARGWYSSWYLQLGDGSTPHSPVPAGARCPQASRPLLVPYQQHHPLRAAPRKPSSPWHQC